MFRLGKKTLPSLIPRPSSLSFQPLRYGSFGGKKERENVEKACAPERLDPRIVDPQVRKKKRVIVGVSGGVDSSVSLLLMKNMGFDVVAVHMVNWDQSEDGGEKENMGRCSAIEDQKDAEIICSKLGIPLHVVHYVREYWNRVFQPSLDVWQVGGTPNPDVLCNREIKFKAFLNTAIHQLGADFIAMGHYSQKRYSEEEGKFQLVKGVDPGKDQSYFLSLIQQDALSRTLFPLGGLHKSQVRQIAEENDLSTAAKRDSVGLCFVGKRRNFQQFLSQYLVEPRGAIYRIDTMEHVGDHGGLSSFTIGERSRIQGRPEALFVCGKDTEANVLYVCPGKESPDLSSSSFVASSLSWVAGEAPTLYNASSTPLDSSSSSSSAQVPISVSCRYQQRRTVLCSSFTGGALSHHPFPSTIPITPTTTNTTETFTYRGGGETEGLGVKTENPLFGVTPGQTAVFYQGDVCLGGGVIVGCVPHYNLPHFTTEYPMSQLSSISPPAWVPTGSPPRHSIRLSFGTTPEPWNKRSAWREKKKKKKKNPNRGGGGGSEGVKRVLRKQARGVEVEVSKEGEMDFYLN